MKIKHLLIAIPLMAVASLRAQVPVANFSVTSPACSGATLNITSLSTNTPTSWSYTMTGGAPATSTIQNPAVVYAAPGTYSITLVATNGSGPSAPVTKTLTVIQGANFFINPASKSMCIGGGPVSFTAMPTGTVALTYSWTTSATTTTISVSPTVTTSYTCTSSYTNGCTASHTAQAVVNPLPTVSITANPTSICAGGTSTLTASASAPGPFTYSWSTAATSANISTSLTGVYNVTVTNGNGCKGSQTYSLGASTGLSLTATSNPTAVCSGNTATLTVTGASNYTWSTGAMTSTVAVTPTTSTTYTVIGTSGSCTGTTSINLTVNTNPTVTPASSSSSICAGNSATLTASGASTYTWLPGLMTGSAVVVSPTVSLTYSVIGSNGCGVNTKTISVAVNPTPFISAFSSSTLICAGQTAVITASSSATSYTWSTGSNSMSISVTPSVTSTYTVTGSAAGCTATAVFTQSVSPCTGISQVSNLKAQFAVYPNPNNGEFSVSVENLNAAMQIEVYNTLGQQLSKTMVKENVTTVRLGNVPEGIYLVRISADNKKIYETKIIKN